MSVAGEEAIDRAQNFSGGVVAAARLRERWQLREANATDEETREQFREAIADLEARYGDLEEVPVGGAEAFARSRGHGSRSRSPVHQGRQRPQPSKPAGPPGKGKSDREPAKGEEKGRRRGRSTSRRGRRVRRTPYTSPTPRVDRAIEQTGIPATARSGGSLALGMIGATIGLSLLYLVFRSGESRGPGSRAIPTVVSGTTRAVGRFLSSEDFWGSGAATSTATGAAAISHQTHPGAYNKRVRRGEVAGPPTPPAVVRKQKGEVR